MAVYEHTYKRYTGALTPKWSRFSVLPRYAFRDVFKSRFLVFFFAICLLPPLIFGALIYLRHNLDAIDGLKALGINVSDFFEIDESFFKRFLMVQGQLAFALTLFIGPGLVSRDLANNGLPLFLSRPISRTEYVVGKLAILLTLLSAITWIAGLALFFLNGNMTSWGWMVENAHLAMATLVGSLLWISLLALLALALSAWVRWKVVAGVLMLMVFFIGFVLAMMTNQLFRTDWGHVLNPTRMFQIVNASLLGVQPPNGPPLWGCLMAFALLTGFCLLLLHLKIRAYRVVS